MTSVRKTRPPSKAPTEPAHPNAWRSLLIKNKEGNAASNAANVTTILRHHPAWAGLIAFDEFAEWTMTLSPPPWFSMAALRTYLRRVREEAANEAPRTVAKRSRDGVLSPHSLWRGRRSRRRLRKAARVRRQVKPSHPVRYRPLRPGRNTRPRRYPGVSKNRGDPRLSRVRTQRTFEASSQRGTSV